ncbi:MAG: hypothetical protein Fur0020_03370 [Thermodesulfovibrionia bacterium]
MGYEGLIASLKRKAEETIHSIWMEAGDEIEVLKEEASKRLKEIRERYEGIKEVSSRDAREWIISEARQQEREIRLKAEDNLSKRLFEIALNGLGVLRNRDYHTIFSMLVMEIPQLKWGKVEVNPMDVEMAGRYFPMAEVIPNEGIIGGFVVFTMDGKVCVDNTFNKRLERAWDELLPMIIRDVYEFRYNGKISGEPS